MTLVAFLRLGGTVDKDASAIADWVVRVMDEAEKLTTADKLSIRERAYGCAVAGMLRRDILKQMLYSTFYVGPVMGT